MTDDILSKKAAEIDRIIDGFLPAEDGPAKTVKEAMNYSIHVGGKRLRPMMMQESFIMFDPDADKKILYPFMAAIEMIHTYSLCHDDLPAMDNDMYRRGKKSTHAMYGEAMGILAGDALLNYAFETALRSFDEAEKLSADDQPEAVKRVSRALSVLAQKAGIYGMVAGQVVDIESEGRSDSVTMDTIKFIHENKTAAMIESSLMIGAILAGAKVDDVRVMESVGSDVGLAFQIRDDILDITGSYDKLGKPVGSDEKNDKTTYVTLVGLDKASEDVKMLSDRAIENIRTVSGRAQGSGDFLTDLIMSLVDRDH